MKWVGEVAYKVSLPLSLSNLHNVSTVFQLWKYVWDSSHAVQMDDMQVRGNLIVEASLRQIYNREVRQLRGKEIILVKIV